MATILVVDDELGIRDLLFEILNDEGHQVELAMNAAEARAIRAQLQPDLVLLDLLMPDMDGFETLRQIRALEGPASHLPVVVMSADPAAQSTGDGAGPCFDGYVDKPLNVEGLSKVLLPLARHCAGSAG